MPDRFANVNSGAFLEMVKSHFTFTYNATGAESCTLFDVHIQVGQTITIDWGDGSTTTHSGNGGISHAYAGAGAWKVIISNKQAITAIDLTSAKMAMTVDYNNTMMPNLSYLSLTSVVCTWTVSQTAPMPTGLTFLRFTSQPGIIWVVNTANPMPPELTTLRLATCHNISWTVSVTAPMPPDITYLNLGSVNGIIWNVGPYAPMPAGLTQLRMDNFANLTWVIGPAAPIPPLINTALTLMTIPGISGTINAVAPMPATILMLVLSDLPNLTWVIDATAPMSAAVTNLVLSTLPLVSWTVNVAAPMPAGVQYLQLGTLPITWVVSAAVPMPAGIIQLALSGLPNLTWLVSATALIPAGSTSLVFDNIPGLTWVADVTNPIPNVCKYLFITLCNGVSIPAAQWANKNALQEVEFTSGLLTAVVDDILLGVWTNKANYTYSTPVLDLLGNANQAPSGVYQEGSGGGGEPVSGKEYAYDLVIGHYTTAGPEWVVTTA